MDPFTAAVTAFVAGPLAAIAALVAGRRKTAAEAEHVAAQSEHVAAQAEHTAASATEALVKTMVAAMTELRRQHQEDRALWHHEVVSMRARIAELESEVRSLRATPGAL